MAKLILYLLPFFFLLSKLNPLYAQLNNIESIEQKLNNKNLQEISRAELLLQLSELYLSRNPSKSFLYNKRALFLSKKINNTELLNKSYQLFGDYYSRKGEYDSCIYYLNTALKFSPNNAFTYFYFGQNEMYNGSYSKVLNYYKKAEKLARIKNDLKTLAIVYYSYSDFYRVNLQDSLAQYYITISIKILEKSVFYSDLAMAYNVQAEIYRLNGAYIKALETYVKTAQIAYKILDSNRIGYCLSRIGYIFYMQNDFKQAENYLIKSLDIAKKVKSRNLELFNLKALTDMYSVQGNKEKCKLFANQCILFGKKMNDETAKIFAYACLGTLFYNTLELDSAKIYSNKAYQTSKKNKDYINTLNAILSLLPIEFKTKKYQEVIMLSNEGIQLAKATKTMEHFVELYEYQYKAFEQMGKNEEAFIAYKNFEMYNNNLKNTDVSLGLHKSKLEMSYLNKHLADTLVYIDKATKTKQQIILQKQRSAFFNIIGAIVVSMLSVIIFIIWLTNRKQKKLNLALLESNNDKELLLKEIHHRVKNSLQVVSSLLNLQKGQSKTKSIDELIDESQSKISNIALVHELLYQSSSFKKINLQQYIHKLSAHILQTFTNEQKNITILKNIDSIEISLDKCVPLALIMNEIITNCIKYAFVGKTSGTVEIICKKSNNNIDVSIIDNGVGFKTSDLTLNSGIGLTLIKGFIKQLKGELKYGSNNGCFFVFSFPNS